MPFHAVYGVEFNRRTGFDGISYPPFQFNEQLVFSGRDRHVIDHALKNSDNNAAFVFIDNDF